MQTDVTDNAIINEAFLGRAAEAVGERHDGAVGLIPEAADEQDGDEEKEDEDEHRLPDEATVPTKRKAKGRRRPASKRRKKDPKDEWHPDVDHMVFVKFVGFPLWPGKIVGKKMGGHYQVISYDCEAGNGMHTLRKRDMLPYDPSLTDKAVDMCSDASMRSQLRRAIAAQRAELLADT